MPTSVCDPVRVTEGPYLTTSQLARELGVNRDTVIRWVHAYGLESHHRTAGGHHRWVLAQVEADLAALHPGRSPGGRPVL